MTEELACEIDRLADEEGYLHRSEVLPIIERAVAAAEEATIAEALGKSVVLARGRFADGEFFVDKIMADANSMKAIKSTGALARAVGAAEQAGYTEGFHDALHNTTPKHSEQRKGALARAVQAARLDAAVQAEREAWGKYLEIDEQLRKAIAKHSPFNTAHEGWAVIFEEVDELWDEVRMWQPDDHRTQMMRKEALHIAAMAMRFIQDVCDKDEQPRARGTADTNGQAEREKGTGQ